MNHSGIRILLVEDDPADVELTVETLEDSKISIHLDVVNNGEEALAFLRKEGEFAEAGRPDLLLLDLNMPRMDGRQVLRHVKSDDRLKTIPVVVLTTSSAEEDVARSYFEGANCYITKPVGLDEFAKVVRTIEDFWFTVVRLPDDRA